jgi:hypothetical protein
VPFLRVIRDKRGYETTYLMHWYREGNRQRSRILYVFRTPGSVRVGREALDPEVLRQIEHEYPDIDFDWQVVVENQQVVESSAEPRRPRKKRGDDEEVELPPAPPPAAGPKAVRPEPAAAPAPSQPSIPSVIQGATPDEQIAFLTEWYPVLRQRISERIADPARQETLLALVERLSPAMWTDADQITTGLQQASEALERLAKVFTRRRRRARRTRRSDPAAEEAGSPSAPDPSTPEA